MVSNKDFLKTVTFEPKQEDVPIEEIDFDLSCIDGTIKSYRNTFSKKYKIGPSIDKRNNFVHKNKLKYLEKKNESEN